MSQQETKRQDTGTVPREWFDDMRRERDEMEARLREVEDKLGRARRARDAARSVGQKRHEMSEVIREAVALHARTLDDAALGVPDCVDRNDVDNELYNAVRRLDPEWWDELVSGRARTEPSLILDGVERRRKGA